MPKDYAKHVSKSKHPARGWRKRLLWVIVLLLIVAGIVLGISMYQRLGLNTQTIESWINQAKSLLMISKGQSVEQSADASVDDIKQEDDIQFNFYTNLSAMQVPGKPIAPTDKKNEINPVPMLKPEIKPAVVQQTPVTEKYLLQVAAFKNPTAAGEMRISLLLAGFEVEIVKAMNNNQQIYQLQQGPFRTLSEAKSMQRVLKNKGIDSVIIKKIQ